MLKVSNNKITIGTKFKAYNKCQVNRTAAEKKKIVSHSTNNPA